MLNKQYDIIDFEKKLISLRCQNRKIVFTNGCFDILHAGHVKYLQDAKDLGDCLVVGLNSDLSVQIIKGNKRPIVSQAQRSLVLSALSCVDYILLFDEPDPLSLIKKVRPNILVKGSDWQEKDIIGAGFVKETGGQVITIPLVSGISTSIIIDRIIRNHI